LNLNSIYIIFEVTFTDSAIRENHLAVPMLDPLDPLAKIAAAVGPVHFSVTVPLIFFVFAFVKVSARPLKNSLALLPVVLVVALVAVAYWTFCAPPLASALLHTASKIADISRAVRPSVLSFAFRFSVIVLARV